MVDKSTLGPDGAYNYLEMTASNVTDYNHALLQSDAYTMEAVVMALDNSTFFNGAIKVTGCSFL
jgi:hypothetical protein